MKSKGFTIFEVLVSLVILSVLMLSLINLYTQDDQIQTYYELQDAENKYIESSILITTKNINLKTIQKKIKLDNK